MQRTSYPITSHETGTAQNESGHLRGLSAESASARTTCASAISSLSGTTTTTRHASTARGREAGTPGVPRPKA